MVSYGLQFATFTATIVHVFSMFVLLRTRSITYSVTVWYRKDIARQFRRSLRQERDVHSRLMLAYREVPNWWYALLGLIAFVIGLVVIEVFDTKASTQSFTSYFCPDVSSTAPRVGLHISYCLVGVIHDPRRNYPSRY